MENQICALPARCSSCGVVFDLSYDLSREGEETNVEEFVRAIRAHRIQLPLLCWTCRI